MNKTQRHLSTEYLYTLYFTIGSFLNCVEGKDKGTGHSQDVWNKSLLSIVNNGFLKITPKLFLLTIKLSISRKHPGISKTFSPRC